MNHEDVVIVGAARTPQGRLKGQLSSLPSTALGSAAIRGALEKAGIEPEAVDAVLVGQVLVLLLLIWHRRRLVRRLRDDGEQAARGSATRFEPTARALLWTVLIAVPIPLLLLVFSTWLQGGVFVEAVGQAFRVVAIELLLQVIEP